MFICAIFHRHNVVSILIKSKVIKHSHIEIAGINKGPTKKIQKNNETPYKKLFLKIAKGAFIYSIRGAGEHRLVGSALQVFQIYRYFLIACHTILKLSDFLGDFIRSIWLSTIVYDYIFSVFFRE